MAWPFRKWNTNGFSLRREVVTIRRSEVSRSAIAVHQHAGSGSFHARAKQTALVGDACSVRRVGGTYFAMYTSVVSIPMSGQLRPS